MSEKRFFQRILDYFPSVGNDAARITWDHAVNSQEKLREALQSRVERQFNGE